MKYGGTRQIFNDRLAVFNTEEGLPLMELEINFRSFEKLAKGTSFLGQ